MKVSLPLLGLFLEFCELSGCNSGCLGLSGLNLTKGKACGVGFGGLVRGAGIGFGGLVQGAGIGFGDLVRGTEVGLLHGAEVSLVCRAGVG